MAMLVTSSLSAGFAGAQSLPEPNTIVSDSGAVIAPASLKSLSGMDQAGAQPAQGNGQFAPQDQQDINLETELGSATLPMSTTSSLSEDMAQPKSLYVDTRYPITNAAAYPNRAIVLLTFDNGGSSYRCSGFLINPNTVATAGHCLNFNGGWSYNVRAYPGYTGSAAPYGSCGYRSLYSVTGWTQDKNSAYDYGVVKLDCAIGNTVGWLGIRWQAASLNGLAVSIQGYPADKGWGQWGHNGTVSYSFDHYTYSSFTSAFNGGPVFDSGLRAVSIYTTTAPEPAVCNGNVCQTTSAYYSVGTRITEAAFNNMVYWMSL
jgi:glutamyl endopeptidase